MSWIADRMLSFPEYFCVAVLRQGPIPKHVAFIMDGNRRFARKHQLEHREGHNSGFRKLAENLQWCISFGIQEVTYYAFSLDNLNRSREEVALLMDLAREKYKHFTQEIDKIMEYGICLRMIGNFDFVPQDIRKYMAAAMLKTKDNRILVLNLAFAYTSTDEMTNAIRTTLDGVTAGSLQIEDITTDLLDGCMYTLKNREPDILIRTSGEIRFSNFFLWQLRASYISFIDVLWPEHTFWHIAKEIFMYQRNAHHLKLIDEETRTRKPQNLKVTTFIKEIIEGIYKKLKEFIK